MARRFLMRWLITVLLLLAAVVSFNGLLDPYGLIGAPRWTSLNAVKPAAGNRSRVVKPYQVSRADADVLILGNSRPEMGLDPRHACIAAIGPGYSLTLPGAGMYQVVRYAQHAMAEHRPRLLLLGLDFVDFLVPPGQGGDPDRWPPYVGDFEARLSVSARGQPTSQLAARLGDYRDALLSLTAFKDAVHTLLAQHRRHATDRRADGFNPARDYLGVIAGEGQAVLFRQKLDELRARLRRTGWSIDHAGRRGSADFTALERLLQEADSRGIAVIAFINPYHDLYLEAIETSGLGDLFGQWKRRLASLVARYPGVTLWDFAESGPYTFESPPAAGDRKRVLRWFWEPAHYRRELGDRLLATMLADRGCALPADDLPAIGRRLVP